MRIKIDLHSIIINLLCQTQSSLTQEMLMMHFCNSQAFITCLDPLKSSCTMPVRLFKYISISSLHFCQRFILYIEIQK